MLGEPQITIHQQLVYTGMTPHGSFMVTVRGEDDIVMDYVRFDGEPLIKDFRLSHKDAQVFLYTMATALGADQDEDEEESE